MLERLSVGDDEYELLDVIVNDGVRENVVEKVAD